MKGKFGTPDQFFSGGIDLSVLGFATRGSLELEKSCGFVKIFLKFVD
jgi:hypothetical protein